MLIKNICELMLKEFSEQVVKTTKMANKYHMNKCQDQKGSLSIYGTKKDLYVYLQVVVKSGLMEETSLAASFP